MGNFTSVFVVVLTGQMDKYKIFLFQTLAVSNQGRGILVGRGNGKVMFFEPKTGRRLEFLGH